MQRRVNILSSMLYLSHKANSSVHTRLKFKNNLSKIKNVFMYDI